MSELLNDERFAEQWISFWLGLLAENPTLLWQSMGSTGPSDRGPHLEAIARRRHVRADPRLRRQRRDRRRHVQSLPDSIEDFLRWCPADSSSFIGSVFAGDHEQVLRRGTLGRDVDLDLSETVGHP